MFYVFYARLLRIQRYIFRSYEDDIVEYAEKQDKAHIKECFQPIPKLLSKENKKFQYSVVKKRATASKYAGSLQWIEDAGIIFLCYNLSIPELPLDGNALTDIFKAYMRDCGYFHENGTQTVLLSQRQRDGGGFRDSLSRRIHVDEVKATTGNIQSTKTILKHLEKYHVNQAVKPGDYNVGRSKQTLTLPFYMAFLLRAL